MTIRYSGVSPPGTPIQAGKPLWLAKLCAIYIHRTERIAKHLTLLLREQMPITSLLCLRAVADEVVDEPLIIPLYLVLGAASKTMVSRISLGLSRTTAGVIATKAANPGVGQSEAKDWLLKQNLEGMGISGICIREVEKLWRKK